MIQVLGGQLQPGQAGYITAQGRDNPYDTNGFIFTNCLVFGTGIAFLGRPWRAYSRVIFYNSKLTDVVVPEGWNASSFEDQENQLIFAEHGCFGSGAKTGKRVKWVKKLSGSAVQNLADLSFINRGGWVEDLPISA